MSPRTKEFVGLFKMLTSHREGLMAYYRIMATLKARGGYSIIDLENITPKELAVYAMCTMQATTADE